MEDIRLFEEIYRESNYFDGAEGSHFKDNQNVDIYERKMKEAVS